MTNDQAEDGTELERDPERTLTVLQAMPVDTEFAEKTIRELEERLEEVEEERDEWKFHAREANKTSTVDRKALRVERRRVEELEEVCGDVLGWIEDILTNDPYLANTSEMLLRRSFKRFCDVLDSREDEGEDCTCAAEPFIDTDGLKYYERDPDPECPVHTDEPEGEVVPMDVCPYNSPRDAPGCFQEVNTSEWKVRDFCPVHNEEN